MKLVIPAPKFALLFLLLLSDFAFAIDHDFRYCERVVKKWASSSREGNGQGDRHSLHDLLFFLHIPRTGGRTYFHCFLKKLFDSSEECPRSYDKLHFDPRKPKCKLLVTHDDYSLMSKLPRERASVVTILRNPVDRVFSTYEFSIEVAARFLVHPNLTSATQMALHMRSKTNAVSTLDIWPWKYLVPWMRKDLFARRDARKLKGIRHVGNTNPYDMEDMVMPLHVYLNHPIAHDIVHNGATFQIAGLTNNSYISESHAVRHCVQKHKALGEHVLQVAKKRLDNMLYVGLTEDHRESATLFAEVVGAQVISRLESSNSTAGNSFNKQEQNSTIVEPNSDSDNNRNDGSDANQTASTESTEAKSGNMTVDKLMGAYEGCISNLRKAQSRRRVNSLKRIAPANFTKKARRQVPEEVLEQMRSLNNLDLELYGYAKDIFAKQHEQIAQRGGRLEGWFGDPNGSTKWRFAVFSAPVVLLLFFFLFVNARRRTSKVKI